MIWFFFYITLFFLNYRFEKYGYLPYVFSNGILLSYISFIYLAQGFYIHFIHATFAVLFGIALSVFLEYHTKNKKYIWNLLHIFLVFALCIQFSIPFLPSILGGMALYQAESQILPEENTPKNNFFRSLTGLLGFLVGILYFFK